MSATKSKLMEFYKELTDFIDTYEERIVHATLRYGKLIRAALDAQKRALTFRTSVGAAVETIKGEIFLGANVENITRCLDDHAEKRAILLALESGCKREDILALALVYGSKITRDIEGEYAYPACGYCRQYLWENTNPDLEVIALDPDGVAIFAGPLKILYPLPYPSKIAQRLDLRK
ncbi:MAG: hypothetical protein AAB890_01310 [Patescibacteria group bacterium]